MDNENNIAQNADAVHQKMQYNYTQQQEMGQYAAPQPGAYPYYAPPVMAVKTRNPFKPVLSDFIFALIVFALGYLFSRWVFLSWRGWGVAVFTAVYLISITAYMVRKSAFANNAAAWFWFAITIVTGVSYAFWDNPGFNGLRSLFLFCAAVYYVIVASGSNLMGKSGNFLIIDGVNAVILVPFRNFFNQYISFSALRRDEKRGKGLPVFIGLLLAVFLLACLIPMLMRADSGGFKVVLRFIADIFTFDILEFMIYVLIAIPVAAYLYGLVSGAAHKRGTDTIKPEGAATAVSALRFFQPATIYIALAAVCGLYFVFILCQIPYFFSAFTGRTPEGWLNYSEYARQGFFELCGIAAINLVILTVGNVTCKKRRAESRLLKAFNIVFAVITLLLIATAFSKMALYIDVGGLTMPRLMPCVFMVFLTIVFVALIVLQKREFSIVRFSLVVGAVILCVFSMADPDALVIQYNADRHLRGSLPYFDMDVLRRAGEAGVLPAIEVFENTENKELKAELARYLYDYSQWVDSLRTSSSDLRGEAHTSSFESYRAREEIRGYGIR